MEQKETTTRPNDNIWKIALALVCIGILVYGFFYSKNTTANIAFLFGYNLPFALFVWGVFYAAVARKRGGKVAGFSFLAIFISLIVSGLIGFSQQKQDAKQVLIEIRDQYSALIDNSTDSQGLPNSIQQELEYQNHKIASPTNNIPTYEYTKEVSTRFDFPEYVSQEHSFKARFPSKPIITNVGFVTNYAAAIEGEAAYNIFINTLKEAFRSNEDIKSFLEGILETRLALLGGKANLKKTREVLFLENRALEYEYTADIEGHKVYFKGVYFLKRNLAYGITVVCAEETKELAYSKYAYFITSFKLIE